MALLTSCAACHARGPLTCFSGAMLSTYSGMRRVRWCVEVRNIWRDTTSRSYMYSVVCGRASRYQRHQQAVCAWLLVQVQAHVARQPYGGLCVRQGSEAP